MKKYYKYVVDCKITVIAKNAYEARQLVQTQLGMVDREGDDYSLGTSLVEEYSKYTKLGRTKRVRFYEGD